MPSAIPLGFGANLWRAEISSTAKLSNGLAAAVKNRSLKFVLLRDVWRLDNNLKSLLGKIYTGMDNPAAAEKTYSEEEVRKAVGNLRSIYDTISQLHALARKAGLTNSTFSGPAFNSVRFRADEVLDIVDAVELVLDQRADLSRIFDEARQARQTGKLHGLAEIG